MFESTPDMRSLMVKISLGGGLGRVKNLSRESKALHSVFPMSRHSWPVSGSARNRIGSFLGVNPRKGSVRVDIAIAELWLIILRNEGKNGNKEGFVFPAPASAFVTDRSCTG